MNDMSESFIVPLGSVVTPVKEKISAGKEPRKRYVGLEHIEAEEPRLLGTLPSRASTSTNTVFQEGDILFGKLRPNLRKSLQADFGGYCSTDILVLRPESHIFGPYAARLLQSEKIFSKAVQTAVGTKMPRTSWRALSEVPVFLPEISEQRRIARILDAADKIIQRTANLVGKLEQVKQGLLHDLLTRGLDEHGRLRDPEAHPEQFQETPLGRVPKAYQLARFGELITEGPQNGIYKPNTDYSENGYRIVRINNFYDGVLQPQQHLRRVNLSEAELRKYGLARNDLLVNRVNSLKYLGKSAFVPELEEPTVYESNMMRIRVDQSRLLPKYAARLLCSPLVQQQLRRRAKHAVAQVSVNQNDVCSTLFPVPPLEEQHAIVSRADAHERRAESEHTRLAKLRDLKKGLMRDLLTGRKRVGTSRAEEPPAPAETVPVAV